MRERVIHRLTGYDRQTELLAVECDIPREKFTQAKEIAGVTPDDPDAIGSYPLDEGQAAKLLRLLGSKIDVSEYDLFLEAFAE